MGETGEGDSGFGTGGMATKILAARTASTAGIRCGMINGQFVERLHTFLKYKPDSDEPPEGTYFMAMQHPTQANTGSVIGDKRRWILSLPVAGTITIDDGAAR